MANARSSENSPKNIAQLEVQVRQLLEELGYQTAGTDQSGGISADESGDSEVAAEMSYQEQHLAGSDIFENPWIVGFFLRHPEKHPEGMGVVTRWIEKPGGESDEEILPYLVQSIKINKTATILLIEGEGLTPEAMQWLKEQVDDRLRGAYRWEDFKTWAESGGL